MLRSADMLSASGPGAAALGGSEGAAGLRLMKSACHDVEDPDVIQKILKHLGLDRPVDPQNRSPPVDLADQQTTLF